MKAAGKVRLTPSGRVAADLVVSEGGIEMRYSIYLKGKVVLQFLSAARERAELAARLLRLMGIDVEVKRMSGRDVWYVVAYTDKLAAGRKELRDAIAEVVRAAAAVGWVDAGKAERWLEKLEGGRTLKEGWPKYHVGLYGGTLVIRYTSTNPGNIEREVKRLKAMGLEEGFHFTVKMPEGGKAGYLLILKDGLMYAAWPSMHGEGKRRRLTAEFVNYILQRAREKGDDVYRKALEVVKRGERP